MQNCHKIFIFVLYLNKIDSKSVFIICYVYVSKYLKFQQNISLYPLNVSSFQSKVGFSYLINFACLQNNTMDLFMYNQIVYFKSNGSFH